MCRAGEMSAAPQTELTPEPQEVFNRELERTLAEWWTRKPSARRLQGRWSTRYYLVRFLIAVKARPAGPARPESGSPASRSSVGMLLRVPTFPRIVSAAPYHPVSLYHFRSMFIVLRPASSASSAAS